jgi:AcrR family transcriptional regulator
MIENTSPEQPQRRSDGEETHGAILEEAIRLASIEGLSSLTVGRLAEKVGLSKSGLYAHFGSKERLQMEVIEAARRVFEREVIYPGFSAPEGAARIRSLCYAYLSYLERRVFPGGCFFFAMLAEFDAQPGRFREEVSADRREWEALMEQQIGIAQEQGEIDPQVEPAQLVFEIEAAMELANLRYNLDRDPAIIDRARATVSAAIDRARPLSRHSN